MAVCPRVNGLGWAILIYEVISRLYTHFDPLRTSVSQRSFLHFDFVFKYNHVEFYLAKFNLRGVSTNKTIIYFITMQTYKELKI